MNGLRPQSIAKPYQSNPFSFGFLSTHSPDHRKSRALMAAILSSSAHLNSKSLSALPSFLLSSPSSKSFPLPFFFSISQGNFDRLKPNPSSPFPLSKARDQSPSSSSPQAKPLIRCRAAPIGVQEGDSSASPARFRLSNLGPQPGSRKRSKRKGRGIAAGQGNSCGFGMRGQKSRSGPGVRKGFEGGQMPLYRRIPKLRGIAGGMHAGLPKFVPVNLKDIEAAGFKEGDEVSLESLKKKGVINPSGRERSLPLKILADGDLSVKLSIKARSFSTAAREKLVSAGCSLTVLPGRKKWLKPSVVKNLARAEEYFAKKKATVTAVEAASVSS